MNRKIIFFILPLLVPILFFVSSLTPVITRGEGREGLVVKALTWGESFILPLRHGTEVPSKPPLFHWVGYGVSLLTGEVGPMEIRSGSVVGTVILAVSTYLFFTSFSGVLLGLLTTLVLLSSLEVLRYSTQARVDPLFAGVFSASVYCMFSFYVGKGSRVYTGLGCLLFLVLSVLTKGPFGLILPAAVLVLYLFGKWETPDSRVLLKGIAVFLVALLVSSIWYFLAYKVGGDRFLEVQLLKENAYRVVKVEGDERGHEKPFYFSFIYLLLAFIPWSLFIPRILSGVNALKREGEFRNNQILILSTSWLLLFILAVIGSVSKRSVYFLPALPALSYICSLTFVRSQGLVLSDWISKYERFLGSILRLVLVILMIVDVLLLLRSIIFPFLEGLVGPNEFYKIQQVANTLGCLELITYLVVFIFIYREMSEGFLALNKGRVENGIVTIALAFILMFYSTQALIVSRIMELESPESFMGKVIEVLPPYNSAEPKQIVQYRNEYYAPAFYLDRPVPVIQDVAELSSSRYMFVSESDMESIKSVNYETVLVSDAQLANRGEKLFLLKISH